MLIVVPPVYWLLLTCHVKPDPETIYVPAVTPRPVTNIPICGFAPDATAPIDSIVPAPAAPLLIEQPVKLPVVVATVDPII